MISKKDVKPKPSQPSKITTTFGMKIKKHIEATNKKTSHLKRGRKRSSFIYSQVNIKTHEEIRRTTQQKLTLTQSKIKSTLSPKPLLSKIFQVSITLKSKYRTRNNKKTIKKKETKKRTLKLKLT